MPKYLAALTILLLVGMVFTRVMMMRRRGIEPMNFGKLDKKDYLIPPFALFYFYLVFANAFSLPTPIRQEFYSWEPLRWVGACLCLVGLIGFLGSLFSFGKSLRVGIDTKHPDKLVTNGLFAISRNPIYVAFWIVLIGQFLIFPNWLLLIYLFAATWLIHRQVLREENFLKAHYGQEYADYCQRVKRYF